MTTCHALDDHTLTLALSIHGATLAFQAAADEYGESLLPTAASLARDLRLPLEKVKKRLQSLRQAELIQVVSAQPKRYRFDLYGLQKGVSVYLTDEQLACRQAVAEALLQQAEAAKVQGQGEEVGRSGRKRRNEPSW